MPEQGLDWIPRTDTLTTDELLRLVRVAVDNGVTTVRLTGGEPLLRPDIVAIVAAIRAMPGAPDVALTTNGLRLPGLAAPLADAGLGRVNISLDTMDRDRFLALTRRDRLIDTLAGIAAAKAAGLDPVKINSVLMRGVNDDEAATLLLWAMEQGLHLRFIEQMPLDPSTVGMPSRWSPPTRSSNASPMLGSTSSRPTTGVGAGGTVPGQRRAADRGHHRVHDPPFCGDCNRMRPHVGRPMAQLPVRPVRDGSPDATASRRHRRAAG